MSLQVNCDISCKSLIASNLLLLLFGSCQIKATKKDFTEASNGFKIKTGISKQAAEQSVNCSAFFSTQTKKMIGKPDEENPALFIKMNVPEQLMDELMDSSYRLSCFANCSRVSSKCSPKVMLLDEKEAKTTFVPSLITLVLDVESKNMARCLGITDFFEYNQKPSINFERTDPQAVLTCSLFIRPEVAVTTRKRGFWEYVIYGTGVFFVGVVILVSLSVCENRCRHDSALENQPNTVPGSF